MSGSGAFRGDPGLKERACADAGDCLHPGWHAAASESDRAACAAAFGLSVAFLNLMATAARPPFMEGSGAFLRETLEGVEPGADLDRLVREWMLRVWSDPDRGAGRKLAHTSAFEPASQIVEQVRANGARPVSRAEWRRLRSILLATLVDLRPDTTGYARVVAAMAWDPALTPGLASDVWTAWERASVGEVDLAHGWDQPLQDALTESLRHAMRETYAAFGPLDDGASSEDQATREVESQARVDAIMVQSGTAERWKALRAHWDDHISPFFPAWRTAAMGTIVAAAQGVPARAMV